MPAQILGKYYPIIYVNYKRRYFISYCLKARITVDTNINFSKVKINSDKLKLMPKRILEHNILEIKFDSEVEGLADLISKIANEFNLIYTKCSKYTKAIENTF